jgi:hypothetical protein
VARKKPFGDRLILCKQLSFYEHPMLWYKQLIVFESDRCLQVHAPSARGWPCMLRRRLTSRTWSKGRAARSAFRLLCSSFSATISRATFCASRHSRRHRWASSRADSSSAWTAPKDTPCSSSRKRRESGRGRRRCPFEAGMPPLDTVSSNCPGCERIRRWAAVRTLRRNSGNEKLSDSAREPLVVIFSLAASVLSRLKKSNVWWGLRQRMGGGTAGPSQSSLPGRNV